MRLLHSTPEPEPLQPTLERGWLKRARARMDRLADEDPEQYRVEVDRLAEELADACYLEMGPWCSWGLCPPVVPAP